jgi:hypothetical protein
VAKKPQPKLTDRQKKPELKQREPKPRAKPQFHEYEGRADVSAQPGPRPPLYRPEYAEQTRKAAQVGITDSELMRLLGIDRDTFIFWKMTHMDFYAACRANTEARTTRVEDAYFQRAVGYEHPSEQINVWDGEVIRTATVKHIPADVRAAERWLETHDPRYKRSEESAGVDRGTVRVVIENDPGPNRMRMEENRVDPKRRGKPEDEL